VGSKCLRITVIVLAVVYAVATLAVASDSISGTIQSLDQAKGSFTLMTDDDQIKVMQAPVTMLQTLQPGDSVEVEIEDGRVTNIYKEE
jgi:hypothetical protein